MAKRALCFTEYEFLSLATDLLDQRATDPEYPYWRIDEDEDSTYCLDCLKAQIGPSFDYSEDIGERFGGGYAAYGESDGSEVCQKCYKLLAYTLTDYGVAEELSHFTEYPDSFDWDNADQCYELARIAHGIWENVDQERALIAILLHGNNRPSTPYAKRLLTMKTYKEGV